MKKCLSSKIRGEMLVRNNLKREIPGIFQDYWRLKWTNSGCSFIPVKGLKKSTLGDMRMKLQKTKDRKDSQKGYIKRNDLQRNGG